MDAVVAIQRLHEHRMWCNRQLLAAARTLPADQLDREFPIGLGTVNKTLAHLYAAEWIWLETFSGNPQTPSPFDFRFADLATLQDEWEMLNKRWDEYLSSALPQANLETLVTKRSSLTGKTMTTPLLDILLHICTHAQYTTAQAVNMLRHCGIPADQLPDSMLITMSRLQNAGVSRVP